MIQDIIVTLLIGAALFNTFYQAYRIFSKKNKSACGGCPNCGFKSDLASKNFQWDKLSVR